MRSNIILIGFMGTGKTVLGKRLAEKLEMGFFDTDEEIEKISGMPIGNIFQAHGEKWFRLKEEEVVKKAAKLKNHVIATGGGVVLNSDNLKILSDAGIVITLEATPEEIQKRVIKNKESRPLLAADCSLESIKGILTKRESMYEKADYKINTTGKEPDEILEEAIRIVQNHG